MSALPSCAEFGSFRLEHQNEIGDPRLAVDHFFGPPIRREDVDAGQGPGGSQQFRTPNRLASFVRPFS